MLRCENWDWFHTCCMGLTKGWEKDLQSNKLATYYCPQLMDDPEEREWECDVAFTLVVLVQTQLQLTMKFCFHSVKAFIWTQVQVMVRFLWTIVLYMMKMNSVRNSGHKFYRYFSNITWKTLFPVKHKAAPANLVKFCTFLMKKRWFWEWINKTTLQQSTL